MKKFIIASFMFFAFSSVLTAALPRFYIDLGAGSSFMSPEEKNFIFSGTGSIGITFVDNFSVYYQFQGGYNQFDMLPDYLQTKGYSTFMHGIGLEYAYYFGVLGLPRLGVKGGLSAGMIQKQLMVYVIDPVTMNPSFTNAYYNVSKARNDGLGAFFALNIGVSYIVSQHIEPFIVFQYSGGYFPYINSNEWPIDSDVALYIGVRINIFKNHYLDKNY